MMFMIPMPPDEQRHAGDAGEERGHGLRRFPSDAGDFVHRANHEVVLVSRLELMPHTQQSRNGVGDPSCLGR
jgi:hypothetical protein